jgi:hypothetical protein
VFDPPQLIMRIRLRLITYGLAILAFGFPLHSDAQTVVVRVVDGESTQPMFGALAYLVDAAGGTVKNTLTDERGRALFTNVPAGAYRVRVEMIGMTTAESDLFDLPVGMTHTDEFRLESSAIQLEGLEVELEAGRCRVRPGGEGLVVAQVWDEARKALSAASFTDQRGAYRYELIRYERQLDRGGVLLDEQQVKREGYMATPFESRPAEDLATNGYVQRDGRDYVYYAPDADVLLSDAFLDAHCFRLAGRDAATNFIGLGFEPTGDDKTVPDIAGTLWIDSETAELRWLDFQYQFLQPEMMTPDVGGRVDFERMPNGTWIVPEWWIRMPVMSSQTDFRGNRLPYVAQYHQTGGLVVAAREAGGRSLGQRAETGGIEGVVTDSLGAPMRGVRVGVIGSNQEVYSNAEGAFSITGLTAGRYQVRFVAADLEQLGFLPEPVTRDVIRGEMSSLEYHMPSIGDVFFEACRGTQRAEGSAVLMGTVVNARGRPVPEATVRIRWVGYYAGGGGDIDLTNLPTIGETTDGFEATAGPTGAFRFCEVPTGQRVMMYAVHGDARSEEFELTIAAHEVGVVRVLEISPR